MRVLAALAVMVATWSLSLTATDTAVVTGEAATRVDAYLARLVPFGFSGSVLVAQGGRVVLRKGYGSADRQKSVPYTPETVGDIGSVTKQFTAAAILKLEMAGKLHVEDPIARYLPGVPTDKAGITIHQLLTHSGGLRDAYGGEDSDPIGRDDLVKLVLTTPLATRPGEGFEYSNENYSLLAAIIERVSGQPYEQFLREALFAPAGMAHTGYLLPNFADDQLARGYTRDGQLWGLVYKRGWRPEGPGWYLLGNGGIHSTVGDLFLWDRALDSDLILNAAARAKLFAPAVSTPAGGQYAYGWGVQRTPRNTTVIAHNGGNTVFAADFRRYRDEHTTIIALSNGPVSAAALGPRELDALTFAGPDVVLPPAVVEVAERERAGLAGHYVGPDGASVDVAVHGAGLRLEIDAPTLYAPIHGLTAPGGRFAAREDQTRGLIEAGSKGDFEPIIKAFNDDRPPSVISGNHTRFWAGWRERFGEYASVAILGTGMENGDLAVNARIRFARGSVLVRYFWGPRRLVGFGIPDAPPPVLLLPEPARSFAWFDFATRSTARAVFADDRVTITAGGATLDASRRTR